MKTNYFTSRGNTSQKPQKPRGERNSFLTPLVVEVMPSGRTLRLAVPFTFRWKSLGTTIRIPAGFVTDFASIPRFARMVIPKLGRYNKAAVVHDAIYQGVVPGFNRYGADQAFLAGMVALGVAPWKRRLMYWAVRLGGWAAWRKRK